MNSFRCGSGRASVGRIAPCGVFEACYTGNITAKAFDVLRCEALRASLGAATFVVRLDGGLFRADDNPEVTEGSYSEDVAPGALIVRPDQYAMFSAYAARAARYGVMRSVWLDSHSAKAYEWAIRQALAAQQELRL